MQITDKFTRDSFYNILAALLITGGYFIHEKLAHVDIVDSLILRIFLSLAFLMNFFIPFFWEKHQKYQNHIFSLLMIAASLVSLTLVYLNHFEESYALGNLVLLTLVNISSESLILLRSHSILATIGTILGAFSGYSTHLPTEIYLMTSLGIIASTYQVTENRMKLTQNLLEATKKAQEAAKTREEFLARMSHEIRTPLNGILPVVELLQQTPLSEEQKNYLKVIETAGGLLSTIINDILDMSKLEKGDVFLSYEPHDLKAMVNQIIKLHLPNAQKKNLKLTVDIPPKELYYKYDEVRLSQVLNNLISNAIKFTEEGGVQLKIEIQEEKLDSDVLIFLVEDTGIGIPKDKQESIFDAFSQVDGTISRRYGGTGLGLTICRQLVQAMGSKIQVESPIYPNAKNPGSRFSFTLELQRTERPVAKTAEIKKYPESLGLSGNVLVIEDNPINRSILTTILKKAGLEVTEAEDGQKGLKLAQKKKFDLIFLDIEMPNLNGYEVAKIIRTENNINQYTLIVCITAHAMSGDRYKALQSGMDYYLAKPFKTSDIFDLLKKLNLTR